MSIASRAPGPAASEGGIALAWPKSLRPVLVAIPAAGLVAGLLAKLGGFGAAAGVVFAVATVPVLLVLLHQIVTTLRRGEVGLDVVAALSMAAALAFGEYLAANVVALMYAGGQYLENFAERRARREMTALLSRVPRTTLRHRDGALDEIDIDVIVPGDRLLVRQGDVVPVDGSVAEGIAVLDQSALTGEAMPVELRAGEAVMSGSANVGAAFDLLAARRAAESTYAGIVRLVEAAQRSRAPMARLADRFAMAFLGLTVALAAAAWYGSGDPIRAVAVLVVATPCPLILAVPIAIVAGVSRAAKHGILIKGGKALETLARVRTLVLDKTGTLTYGGARLVATHPEPPWSAPDVLRLAASLDQASKHIIAQSLVAEARARGLALATPAEPVETPGEGVEGRVDDRTVIVGGLHFVAKKVGAAAFAAMAGQTHAAGSVTVAVAVDGKVAGVLVLADQPRVGTAALLADLRALGIERVVLATGDRRAVAEAVAAGLPFDAVRAELTPDQKVLTVLSERKDGPVMMIGDGVNDAPALAAADVGLAMGAKGAAASAEAADIVLLVDALDRTVPALRIARRALFIARQSVWVGIGLSVLGMATAALGLINPVEGALIQEAIDIAVILNALRALYDPLRAA